MAMSKKTSCCLFGCLGTFGTVIILTVGSIWWLTKSGNFEEDATVYQPDSQMYVRGVIRPEDETMIGILADLAYQSQEMDNQNMPEQFRWINEMNQKDRATLMKELKKYMPMEFEASYMGTDEQGRQDFLASIGFGPSKNLVAMIYYMMRWTLREEGQTQKIGDHEVIAINENDGNFYLHLDNGVYYISVTEKPMRDMIEGTQRQVGVDQALSPLYRVDTKSTIYGFITKESMVLFPTLIFGDAETNDWGYETDREVLRAYDTEISQIGFDLQAQQANQLQLRYFIFCEAGEAFASHLNETEQRLEQQGIRGEYKVIVAPQEYGYQVDIVLTDVSAVMQALMQDLQKSIEENNRRRESGEYEETVPVETEQFDEPDQGP